MKSQLVLIYNWEREKFDICSFKYLHLRLMLLIVQWFVGNNKGISMDIGPNAECNGTYSDTKNVSHTYFSTPYDKENFFRIKYANIYN